VKDIEGDQAMRFSKHLSSGWVDYLGRLREGKHMAQWKCSVCGYVYDETTGDPQAGIPAGTSFEDLPDSWTCPVCGAGKEAFGRVSTADVHEGSATTVSDVLVAELVAWGVDLVFGLPGTSSLGIVEAIRKIRMRYIVVGGKCSGCFGI
jgi:rubredoxin